MSWRPKSKKCVGVIQGTPEWQELRHYHFNGSNLASIAAEQEVYKTGDKKGTIKPNEALNTHLLVKAQGQNLALIPNEIKFANGLHGHEQEQHAIDCFCGIAKIDRFDVLSLGVFDIDEDTLLMSSPDALHFSGQWGIEIKSPTFDSGNHFYAIKNIHSINDLKEYNKNYYWQLIAYFLVFDPEFWFWVSYLGCLNEKQRLHVVKIKKSEVESEVVYLREKLKSARQMLKNELNYNANQIIEIW